MKRKLFMLCVLSILGISLVSAQTRKITGTVSSASDGLTLPGVSIVVKGTTVGATTNIDGKYELNVPADATTLVFSFIGMTTQEINIQGRAIIDIVMELEAAALEEVVVVGYGTQIKSKVTGNITKVAGDKINNVPVPTVELALQGKAAGVFVEAVNGKATGVTRIRIRGASSISASSSPLFIIDGVPLNTESLNSSGAAINPLAGLNFNDVESIDILKDASSAAIYGSRGANGVILVTTKKGKTGETKLNFSLQRGISTAARRREFLNTDQFISYFREASYNSDLLEGYDPINNAGDYSGSWLQYTDRRLKRYSGWAAILDPTQTVLGKDYVGSQVNTDWQDQAFQTGKMLMADVSASGGSDKLKFFASGSYNNQQGILVSNGLEKLSGRLNIDNKVNSFIDMGFALSLSRTSIDQVSADNAFSTPMQLVAMAPITPVRDLDGVLYNTPTTTYYNGLIDVEEASRNIVEYRTVANSYMNFLLTKGLSWRNELGIDIYNLKENARYGERTDGGQGVNGSGFFTYGQTQGLVSKSYLNYLGEIKDFGVSAVLGTEFQKSRVDQAFASGEQFPLDDLKTLASAGEITGATSTITEYSFLSYFSRVNLDYKSKFLLTVSGRVDGSSRFGTNTRYGFFPAVAVGWVLTKEDFLTNNSVVSFLKVRTSYGETGNAGIGNFTHLGLWGVNSYNGQSGLTPTQIANPDLGWETTKQVDFGIDFGFLNNRISGEIDYYIKKTSDLLLDVPVPASSGYSTQIRNVGSMENKGIEFVLNTNNLTGQIKWNTNFNISLNKNKVTDIGDQEILDEGSSRFMNVVKKGEPIGVFYGAEYAGVDPANGDALWYLNTKDADGNIIDNTTKTSDFDAANFIVLGNPNPELMSAITNTFDYKGIELSFTFQGVFGNKIHLTGDPYMAANGAWYDNQTTDQLKSWKNPGDITDIPQARLGYSNGDQARSSRYLSDGSYIKLRTLQLSYQVPTKFINKYKISSIRVYLQGQNLWMSTKYKGWDPEVSSDFVVDNVRSGIDFYSAPQPRSITFGINIGL